MPNITIDLNCDMGESFGRYTLGNDAAMFRAVTSVNIACGLHAGDPTVIANTIAMAVDAGISIGAHPGFPDMQGFGRRMLSMTPEDLRNSILYQISALAGITTAHGGTLRHVKPHGALYNLAARDLETAQAIVQAITAFDANLAVMTLPNSVLAQVAQAAGLRVLHEGFADRTYQANGALVPRSQAGAVIHDPVVASERAVGMVRSGCVKAITGEVVPLDIQTLCVHGDTPGADAVAAQLREALTTAGIVVRPPEYYDI